MAWHRLHVWCGALVMLVVTHKVATADIIAGAAWVIDGDTLDIGGTRIRIMSIDALELDQKCTGRVEQKTWYCGQEAARALWDLVGQYSVTCETMGTDYTGRWFGECTIPGMSIANWMAAHGWAVPNQGCKCEEVREWADVARSNTAGIWSSDFLMPWAWRTQTSDALSSISH